MTTAVLRKYPAPGGWRILPIHYSHDPAKTAEWAAAKLSEYAREEDFMKEYEIDFRARAGRPAYPTYNSAIHDVRGLVYDPALPLCLLVDFNVAPAMVWEVAQVVSQAGRLYLRFIAEIVVMAPATIEQAVRDFRNLFPAHAADLRIYGDSTGKGRNPQTGKSDYDLIKLEFRNYSAPLDFRVPLNNPPIKERLNAVARVLRGGEGLPTIQIDPDRCPELVQDFQDVVLTKDGAKIEKTYDTTDPYSMRTHASDDFGYMVCREWPVAMETFRAERKPRPRAPLKYGRLIGDL